jgi:hypothetical protein
MVPVILVCPDRIALHKARAADEADYDFDQSRCSSAKVGAETHP